MPKCSANLWHPIAVTTELPVGTIIHNNDCSEQSLVIHDRPTRSDNNYEWRLALSFDENGNRVIEYDSSVRLSRTRGTHHIAETWWPVELAMPTPKYDCDCGWCRYDNSEECTNKVVKAGELCPTCDDHGTCSCVCECEATVYSSGDMCGWCDDQNVCESCDSAHVTSYDLNHPDMCDDCIYQAKEAEREAEAERLAEEAEEAKRIAEQERNDADDDTPTTSA